MKLVNTTKPQICEHSDSKRELISVYGITHLVYAGHKGVGVKTAQCVRENIFEPTRIKQIPKIFPAGDLLNSDTRISLYGGT